MNLKSLKSKHQKMEEGGGCRFFCPSPLQVRLIINLNVHIQFIEKLYLLLVPNTKVITSNFRVSFGFEYRDILMENLILLGVVLIMLIIYRLSGKDKRLQHYLCLKVT